MKTINTILLSGKIFSILEVGDKKIIIELYADDGFFINIECDNEQLSLQVKKYYKKGNRIIIEGKFKSSYIIAGNINLLPNS